MSNNIRETLINELAKGEFISGQSLGEKLNVSRTAVSKHVKSLCDMGLDIFSVTGKGYKLANPLNLLSQDEITQQLIGLGKNNKVEVHTLIDSTNSYLMRKVSDTPQSGAVDLSQGQVCIAEYQSAGRGRRGRQWVSPFGSHIYLSLYWRLEQGISAAMGLSLVTALAVSDAVKKQFSLDVQLKWPNDIYLDGVKLAGILIELEGQMTGVSHSVIGVGLNLNMPNSSAANIDQPWTDVSSHSDLKIDRNQFCATIISCLIDRLTSYQKEGLSSMLEQWHQQDIYLNKPIQLITGDRVTLGICRGIDNQGAMLLEIDGIVKPIYGGEVSVRPVQ